MTQVAPALRLCKHQINNLATLSPLTLSSSINIFFAYRILQTRLMLLYTLHCPNFNSRLGALLQGATCTRHLYGTTIASHQQFSRCFFEPCAVYVRFCHIPKHQPLFALGLLLNILWKENIHSFENLNKFVMDSLFFLNWLFVIGLISTIFSGGPLFLCTFVEKDIRPLNMH